MKLLALFSVQLFILLSVVSYGAADQVEEFFSSTGKMTFLVDTHAKLLAQLRQVVDSRRDMLIQAENLLDEFELTSRTAASTDPKRFVGNPINSFLLIKQLTTDLEKIKTWLKPDQDQLDNFLNNQSLPSRATDYEGSLRANNRIIDTYKFKLSEWTDVRLNSASQLSSIRPLKSLESFEHGQAAYKQSKYKLSMRWISHALEMHDDQSELIDRGLAQELMSNISEAMAAQLPEEYHKDVRIASKHDSLCRGEKLVKETLKYPSDRSSQLYCRYMRHHPALLIAPIKLEYLSFEPPMYMFHEIVTESQVNMIKAASLKRLESEKAGTAQFRNVQKEVYFRVSQNTWFHDDDHLDVFDRLDNMAHVITNLTLESAEPWQVGNYGLGGFNSLHYDYYRELPVHWKMKRNRIATWLLYLESPVVGGSTVFPYLGLRAEPIYRSAVFWYNTLPSGQGDARMYHAGCPVALGSKWYTTLWFHEQGQEFRRPCDLSMEPDHYFI